MIGFFRKTRRKLANDNQFLKYSRYAVGEILLVVIGILIALNINNRNEFRKQRLTEIEILKGIKDDILLDTIDLNFNIKVYNNLINNDSIVLEKLKNRSPFTPEFGTKLVRQVFGDWSLYLHQSHFDEAKSQGLSIISNKSLRKQISRLYEFHYVQLFNLENTREHLNSYYILKDRLQQYFSYNENGTIINKESYNQLTNDSNAIFLLMNVQRMHKNTLNLFYIPIKTKALEVVNAIDEELFLLKI